MQLQESHVERVTLKLRGMILNGEFAPGERLAEIPVSEQLGVSRTPVRLALSQLEKDGLLVGAPRRGFVVRQITMKEINDALVVRGALEATACHVMAHAGLPETSRLALEACLAEERELVSKGKLTDGDASRWTELNGQFHTEILQGAGNRALSDAIAFNARLPFVGLSAVAFTAENLELCYRRMQAAHAEHVDILDALCKGEASRAEALMREHAYKSAQTLRIKLEEARSSPHTRNMPGLRLVTG
jgi:GntR family transcriptional regulator of vanillate catabolism